MKSIYSLTVLICMPLFGVHSEKKISQTTNVQACLQGDSTCATAAGGEGKKVAVQACGQKGTSCLAETFAIGDVINLDVKKRERINDVSYSGENPKAQ